MKKQKKIYAALTVSVMGLFAVFFSVYYYTLKKNTYTFVKTAKACFDNIEVKLSLTGTIKSNNERKYYRNQSKIKKFNVAVGDTVKRGDLLFSYDISEYESALNQAKIKYDETINNKNLLEKEKKANDEKVEEINLEIKKLEDQIAVGTINSNNKKFFFNKKKSADISEIEKEIEKLKYERKSINEKYDLMVKQLDSAISIAETAYKKAAKKLEINSGKVISDIYGVVTDINYDNNLITSIQNPVITIQNLEDLKITAGLNRDEVSLVKLGQKVDIKYGEKQCKGKVAFINPVASNQPSILSITQNTEPKVNIDISIDGCHDDMKVDFLVDADILINEKKNVITVPNECIKNDECKNSKVYVLKDGMLVEREVQIGVVSDNKSEIISGVSEGEEIVVNPEDDMNLKCRYKGED